MTQNMANQSFSVQVMIKDQPAQKINMSTDYSELEYRNRG